MNIKDTLKHPITGIAVLLSAVGGLSFGLVEPAWHFISVTSTYWFPAIATAGTTIAPEFGYEQLGTNLVVGAGIVFVAVQLDRLFDRAQEWRQNR